MKIKLARIKLGKTQAELCKEVKMSPKKLVDIEKGMLGKVTKNDMEKLANALNSTVQELFFTE